VTVWGKGAKERTVLLPQSVWQELVALGAGPDEPLFRSRSGGGPLTPVQVRRIVTAAAKRAGIVGAVSPHWLRHGHASHALDHGAPVSLVASTLGHANVATTSRYLHAKPGDASGLYLQL
jgi:integrase/recombinase XerD